MGEESLVKFTERQRRIVLNYVFVARHEIFWKIVVWQPAPIDEKLRAVDKTATKRSVYPEKSKDSKKTFGHVVNSERVGLYLGSIEIVQLGIERAVIIDELWLAVSNVTLDYMYSKITVLFLFFESLFNLVKSNLWWKPLKPFHNFQFVVLEYSIEVTLYSRRIVK